MSEARRRKRLGVALIRDGSYSFALEPGGVVRMKLRGIVDLDTVEVALAGLAVAVRRASPGARVLADLQGLTYMSPLARRRAAEALAGLPADRCALRGGGASGGDLARRTARLRGIAPPGNGTTTSRKP